MMTILIIGADGQLGTDLCKVIPQDEQIPLTIKDIDITNTEQSAEVLANYSPDIVINTAAYNDVDKSEEMKEVAFSLNAEAPLSLAKICRQIGATLVHISTDYVFDGKKGSPYVESDQPNPLSVYGASKLAGEMNVAASINEHFIVRTTGLYGVAGCLGKGGGNFVDGMVERAKVRPELAVVTDEIVSPTYSLDLAGAINRLIRTKKYGLYHIVNHGYCSWYDFAVKIFQLLGQSVVVTKTTAANFPAVAKRPAFSAMQNEHLARIGLDNMRPWPEALKAYLQEKGYL
ncbi:MAG: dTDP-4-dehydrorhamnose reductase [bacterium]